MSIRPLHETPEHDVILIGSRNEVRTPLSNETIYKAPDVQPPSIWLECYNHFRELSPRTTNSHRMCWLDCFHGNLPRCSSAGTQHASSTYPPLCHESGQMLFTRSLDSNVLLHTDGGCTVVFMQRLDPWSSMSTKHDHWGRASHRKTLRFVPFQAVKRPLCDVAMKDRMSPARDWRGSPMILAFLPCFQHLFSSLKHAGTLVKGGSTFSSSVHPRSCPVLLSLTLFDHGAGPWNPLVGDLAGLGKVVEGWDGSSNETKLLAGP